jgi:RNA polymerase sigma factor (sigma-70 family)
MDFYMSENDAFVELIRRVRAGDEEASTELVRSYEPAIRIAVRTRLSDPKLRRILDSMDICQSVFGNFFARASSGEFELNRPEQLVGLLTAMARNRVVNHARRQQAARRDLRRDGAASPAETEFVDPSPDPCTEVDGRDLMEVVRRRLSPEEHQIAESWASGESWKAIGAKTGRGPDALRVRLARAFERIRKDMYWLA